MDSVRRDAKIAAAETTRRLQEQRNNVRTERMDSIKKRKVSFNRLEPATTVVSVTGKLEVFTTKFEKLPLLPVTMTIEMSSPSILDAILNKLHTHFQPIYNQQVDNFGPTLPESLPDLAGGHYYIGTPQGGQFEEEALRNLLEEFSKNSKRRKLPEICLIYNYQEDESSRSVSRSISRSDSHSISGFRLSLNFSLCIPKARNQAAGSLCRLDVGVLVATCRSIAHFPICLVHTSMEYLLELANRRRHGPTALYHPGITDYGLKIPHDDRNTESATS